AEVERVHRVQRDQQDHQRQPDAQREQQIEQQRGERKDQQRDDEHDRHGQADLGAPLTRRRLARHGKGSAHARTLTRAARSRLTKASTSATAMYSSAGIGTPTRLLARSARASGLFSTIGTPASAAIALIRCATFRCPIATTTGASARAGSYFRATAMCLGFVTTT